MSADALSGALPTFSGALSRVWREITAHSPGNAPLTRVSAPLNGASGSVT